MIEELLKGIVAQGPLGMFLVLALFVIFFLYKETKKERNEHLKGMKEVWQSDVKFREELKVLLDSILAIIIKNNK